MWEKRTENFTVRVKRLVDDHSTATETWQTVAGHDDLSYNLVIEYYSSSSINYSSYICIPPLPSVEHLFFAVSTPTCPRHFYGRLAPHIGGDCSHHLSINPGVSKPLSFPEQSYPGRSEAASRCEGRRGRGNTRNETNKGRIDKRSAAAVTWTMRILRGE